jgi:hypothetical protein
VLNSKTLYISPGTYLVSKRIFGKANPGRDCSYYDGRNSLVITGDAFDRPTIKLIDGARGFESDENPYSVLQIRLEQLDRENCLFWCGIQNLNFDLGNNPGAVAVHFPSAQDCNIYNVMVHGKNFFAGFSGVPGRNAVTVNCVVNGGQYGFYLLDNSLGASLFGITCRNQTKAGLFLQISRGIAITGVEVTGCEGIPIICDGIGYEKGHNVITDARIELNDPDNFAFSTNDRSIVLKNIYINGTNKLVTGDGTSISVPESGWKRINDYVYTPEQIIMPWGDRDTIPTYNLIDGSQTNEMLFDYQVVSEAPDDFIARHTPDKIYAFNSPGAVNVCDYGAVSDDGRDDYEAIQKAVNENDIVFFPAGEYVLSSPLLLKNNSVLIGENGKRSKLSARFSSNERAWILVTPDIIGKVAVQHFSLDFPHNDPNNRTGTIHWQTSNGFIANIRSAIYWRVYEGDKANFQFSGNAGGKVFGLNDHRNIMKGSAPDSTYRKVSVLGTHNPLTFYGLNLERGGVSGDTLQYPFMEIRDSENVRTFGSKSETDGIIFKISGSENISINSIYAHAHEPRFDSRAVLICDGSENIEINHMWIAHEGPALVHEDVDTVPRGVLLGSYRLGKLDHSAFNKTQRVSACESFTSPGGKVWTSSGLYADTISKQDGSDSILVYDLSILQNSMKFYQSACDSYISPSGKTWNESGAYVDTLTNIFGCDSILSIDLTINKKTFSTISETVCESYTSPSGKVWIEAGTYYDTIQNAAGCDSLITINLNVDCLNLSEETVVHDLEVFPNPAQSGIYITFSLQQPERVELKLLNNQGIAIKQLMDGISGIKSNQLYVDISSFAKGLYLLMLKTDRHVSSKKLIIE